MEESMQDSGWIKLHRSVLNNVIVMKDVDHIAVWMFLLMTATHKEQREVI